MKPWQNSDGYNDPTASSRRGTNREHKKEDNMAKITHIKQSASVSTQTTINSMQESFSKNIQGVATDFGAMLGMTKWYSEMFPKAMEQLKKEGCKYCNHLHCKKCKEENGTALSGWAWDMGNSHEV